MTPPITGPLLPQRPTPTNIPVLGVRGALDPTAAGEDKLIGPFVDQSVATDVGIGLGSDTPGRVQGGRVQANQLLWESIQRTRDSEREGLRQLGLRP